MLVWLLGEYTVIHETDINKVLTQCQAQCKVLKSPTKDKIHKKLTVGVGVPEK